MQRQKVVLASILGGVALAGAGFAHAGTGAAGLEVTYETEQAGVQNAKLTSQSTFSLYGIETFDELTPGVYSSFMTNFGLTTGPSGNAEYSITGTYTALQLGGLQVNPADMYGGAGGTGNYVVALNKDPGYSLTLTTSNPAGIDYFGYWLSALDMGNSVAFYNNNTFLFSFDPQDVINAIGNQSPYFGNPTGAYQGQNSSQPYVFLNFYATGGVTFNKVEFSENPLVGGYESDNHTVGDWLTMSGTPVAFVPEPASWALMLVGVGALGFGLRQRRRGAIVAA